MMASYVGEIQISDKNGFFVNFYPGYRYENGEFVFLSNEDIMDLLPGSQFLNINLVSTSPSFRLEDNFQDGDDVIIDFDPDSLSENLKGDGMRYPTAWKLDLSRLPSGALRHMDDLGYYCVLAQTDVLGDWNADPLVELDSPNINEGMMVMIPSDTPDSLLGPFRVRFDEEKEMFYVRVSSDPKASILSGCSYEGSIESHILELVQEDVTRHYIRTRGQGIHPYSVDRISDHDLLESFRSALGKKGLRSVHFDAPAVDSLLDLYANSLLTGVSVSKNVSDHRCARLREIFSSLSRFDAISDDVASIIGSLMEAHASNPSYTAFVSSLAKSPEFVGSLDCYSDFHSKRMEMEEEISRLSAHKDSLQTAVRELESINPKQQLDMHREELRRIEEMKQKATDELEEANRKTSLRLSMEEMENRVRYLDEEIHTRLQRIETLDAQMEGLQEKLDEILEKSSRKSLEISFDNMISERFLEHTARLEQAKRLEASRRALRAIRNIPKTHLSDEQLVAQLVHATMLRRPEYTRNEILNIYLCLFGGFLTIFKGAPGSGKTSICRIVSEVLSLDTPAKLEEHNPEFPYCSRYVPVSVERGWSSRRDLIGFYNSLTRTFDKADARLFDLLTLMDQEARHPEAGADLPGLVLLDDANLSSMEYYWADFMTMEEDAPVRGTISLGENYMLEIPRSLHFAASIQSDHTTEPLSARLLDRAWVISLPERSLVRAQSQFDQDDYLYSFLISEDQLESVFAPAAGGLDLPEELEEILSAFWHLFEEAALPMSIRTETALRRYVLGAMRWFEADENDEQRNEGIIALDYAVAQRLIPRLSGSSERFRSILEKMKKTAQTAHLTLSASLLDEIMEKGDDSMQFYQFFS